VPESRGGTISRHQKGSRQGSDRRGKEDENVRIVVGQWVEGKGGIQILPLTEE